MSYDTWKTTDTTEDVRSCDYCHSAATTVVRDEHVCAGCAAELLEEQETDLEDPDELAFRRGAEIDRRIDELRGK